MPFILLRVYSPPCLVCPSVHAVNCCDADDLYNTERCRRRLINNKLLGRTDGRPAGDTQDTTAASLEFSPIPWWPWRWRWRCCWWGSSSASSPWPSPRRRRSSGPSAISAPPAPPTPPIRGAQHRLRLRPRSRSGTSSDR